MPKRKAVKQTEKEELRLSPAPDETLEADGNAPNGTKPSSSKRRKIKTEVVEEIAVTKSPEASKSRKAQIEAKVEEETGAGAEQSPKPKAKRKAKVKQEVKAEVEEAENEDTRETKVKRKRKTKEEKEAEMLPLAARTVGHKLFIGAHVSSAGGVPNAIQNSVHIGANAFALFLKSQRKWAHPDLSEEHCLGFHDNCRKHDYDQGKHVVPHGSYLVNLAHTDKARSDQAYESHLDDLKRCERLGIKLYNIHPGNNQCGDRAAAIAQLAKNINKAHSETSSVVILLENMAHGGNVLGSTFEDLRDIIALTTNKERIGVCIDTCHAFAGGYDLRSPSAFKSTFEQFDEIVGFQYLRAMHINDSKAPFASHRDLHANIGTGFLGLKAFHNLVNDSRFEGLPLVLETPIEVRDENGNLIKDEKGKEKEDKAIWAREIKLLESLVGMGTDSEEFLKLEKQLARQGEPERKRLMEQQDRKKEKEEKAKAKDAKKKREKKGGKGQQSLSFGKKKAEESDGSDLSDLGNDDEVKS
ncbi:DNA-(apurinic or apyrimidinic site) lyase 1 [Pseudocercospora fuligena]|uniref:Apurinic-apyrimidinic endonuclease 1 n=1 Tax=Pseudocercospora fuligena TaxID=685502 RepID=A0A8H6RT12_9PEZI|nr:DNA-(apurinic or apyrimidinic site) lyase 1 [Pseudocercospora fuligena]